jgi:hypothetical protein
MSTIVVDTPNLDLMDLGAAHLAGPPLHVELLGQCDGGIVVGNGAKGARVGGSQTDAVVDVEDAVGAARRPDDAGSGDLVLLGVDLAGLPNAATVDADTSSGGGSSILTEVVGTEEVTLGALLEDGIAVIGGLKDGELEAAGVAEVEVQLAVLGALVEGHARTNVGLEGVEAKGDDSAVKRDAGRHGVLGATIARPGDALNLDESRVDIAGEVGAVENGPVDGRCANEGREEKKRVEAHDEVVDEGVVDRQKGWGLWGL